MATTVTSLLRDLKKKEYKPVYFLQGDESFYMDQVVEHFITHTLTPKERKMNLLITHGKEQSLLQLINHVRTFPMMGQRKVVILKNAQDLDALQKKKGQELLINYLKMPHAQNLLVFCYPHKKLPARSALSKALLTHGVLLTTSKIYESQVPTWLQHHVASLGYHITPQATHALQGLIGNDLQRLDRELKKILVNFQEEHTLTEDDITTYVSLQKEVTNFALQDALGERNPTKALQILERLTQNPKQNPLMVLLSLLTSFFSKVLQLYSFSSSNASHLATQLQVHPYFVKKYLAARRAYSLSEITQVLHHLHHADTQVKGIRAPYLSESAILEELVPKILRPSLS